MATELFSESNTVFNVNVFGGQQLKETLNISKFAPHGHMFFYFDIVMILKSNAYLAIGNTNFSYAL